MQYVKLGTTSLDGVWQEFVPGTAIWNRKKRLLASGQLLHILAHSL